MRIDVWTDLGDSSCWELRAHLREALAQFPHAPDVAVVGHAFENDRRATTTNTFDAHRVVHLARARDLEEQVTDALLLAGSGGSPLGDRAVLTEVAVGAGLDRYEVTAMLDSDDFGYQVREDEAIAAEIGISEAPFVVLDQKYALVGDQPTDVLLDAIAQVWEDQGTAPTERVGAGCGGGCGDCMCGA